jgi:hypothetical protein
MHQRGQLTVHITLRQIFVLVFVKNLFQHFWRRLKKTNLKNFWKNHCFSLAAGDNEIHFSAELVEEFSKWVQGFFLFCHLIFLPKICGGPILVQFCHTPLQITLIAEQRISSSQQLQRKMATDAFFFFLPGGWAGGRPVCCYSPAQNLPLNFLDLAFERRFLSLAW